MSLIPPEHKKAHEVQLTGWGESMKSGPWIKFRVDAEAYERFKAFNIEGKNQQRFHLVAVPIDDDETPKQTKPPEPHLKNRKLFHELSRAQQAGILCADVGFQDWVSAHLIECGIYEKLDAGEAVRRICGVDTRAQFDVNYEAGQRWESLLARYREETQLPEQR